MSILGTWFAVSAPWLAGLILAYRVCRFFCFSNSLAVICGAIGGLLGYLAVAAICFLITFDEFFPISSDIRGIYLPLSLVLLLYLFPLVKALGITLNRVEFFLLSILLICISFTAVLSSLQPTSGWDILGYWGPKALTYLDNAHPSNTLGAFNPSTHPHTVSILAAWASTIRNHFQATGPIFAPWFFIWVSILITVIAYTYSHTLHKALSLITGIAFSTIPLVGNHVLIGGYAELFIAATITASTALCSVALKEDNRAALIFGLLVALTAAFYKNIGYLYSTCMLTGFLLAATSARCQSKKNLCMVVFFSCVTLFTITLATFILNDITFTITLGNRWQVIYPRNLFDAPANIFFSLFVNQSFHQTAWLLIFALVVFIRERQTFTDSGPILTVFFVLLLLTSSQASDYSFSHSIPQSDTGLSRFSTILITSAFLLIAPMLKSANTVFR